MLVVLFISSVVKIKELGNNLFISILIILVLIY